MWSLSYIWRSSFIVHPDSTSTPAPILPPQSLTPALCNASSELRGDWILLHLQRSRFQLWVAPSMLLNFNPSSIFLFFLQPWSDRYSWHLQVMPLTTLYYWTTLYPRLFLFRKLAGFLFPSWTIEVSLIELHAVLPALNFSNTQMHLGKCTSITQEKNNNKYYTGRVRVVDHFWPLPIHWISC